MFNRKLRIYQFVSINIKISYTYITKIKVKIYLDPEISSCFEKAIQPYYIKSFSWDIIYGAKIPKWSSMGNWLKYDIPI